MKWLAIILAVVPASVASAQGQVQYETVPPIPQENELSTANGGEDDDGWVHFLISWNMAIGTFDTFDFASNYSFRGTAIEARFDVAPPISLGLSLGLQVLDEKEMDQVVTNGPATASGTAIRTVNFVPLLLKTVYERELGFADGSFLWGSAGIGAVYIQRRSELGLFFNEEDSWHFGLVPEVGIAFPITERTRFFSAVAWNFAFESGAIETQSYLNFNLGLFL
jgi:hypothetical protein